jgi:hypothetical protein
MAQRRYMTYSLHPLSISNIKLVIRSHVPIMQKHATVRLLSCNGAWNYR